MRKISNSGSNHGLTALAVSLLTALCAVLALSSCSDKIYEDLNTDPTKSETLNPSYQLAYAEKQIYGDMNYVDVHRLYTLGFTQHLMGCWNTTNYAGQHRTDDSEMSRPWNNLYTGAFRNLTDAMANTKDQPKQANVYAALTIFRVYVASLLTDYYGDVPYSEAGLNYLSNITQPKYDTQQSIYKSFFKELDAAVALFNKSADPIENDPMFNGDLEKWKRFANSLRLRFAMRISDVDPAEAQTQFNAVNLNDVMASAADDACVLHENISYSFGQESYKDFRGNALAKYFYGNDAANNPSYVCKTFWDQLFNNNDPRTTLICRFYIDDYMDIFTGEGRIDMTDSLVAAQRANADKPVANPVKTGDFSYDPWPQYNGLGGLVARVAEVQAEHPDFSPNDNPRWTRPKLANNLLRSDNPGVIMTYAEVCFLRAEAAVLWATGDDPKAMYEEGVRAAIYFVTSHYGYEPVPNAEINTYLTQPAVDFSLASSNDDKKKLINTQAWILHFHNPAEAWANLRRADAPTMETPDLGKMMDGKTETPVRLCYPLKEGTYNNAAYQDAKNRVIGDYNWNARMWWDVK